MGLLIECVIPLQEDLNAIDMEDDKRDLISREISKFRDTHKVRLARLVHLNWQERLSFCTEAPHVVHSTSPFRLCTLWE